jgi:hypothetical protein
VTLDLIYDDSSAGWRRDEFYNLLDVQLARAERVLTELATLAQSMYSAGVLMSRIIWIMKNRTARRLQAELKNIRKNIHILLCMMTM